LPAIINQSPLLDVGPGATFLEPHGGKFAEAATQWLLPPAQGRQIGWRNVRWRQVRTLRRPEWKVERKNQRRICNSSRWRSFVPPIHGKADKAAHRSIRSLCIDVIEAILARHSVPDISSKYVPKEIVVKILVRGQ
jgi:hypothetical protein